MHAYMFFLQPKAAYFRNTHLFLEMLKKTAIKGTKIETAHTHTFIENNK